MARRKAKAPVEGGTENFQTPRAAMQNGAQTSAQEDGSTYFAGADKDEQPSVRSDKLRAGDPMSDEEIGALIQQELTDARTFIDLEVGPMRAAATEAYRGIVDTTDDEGDSDFLDASLAPASRSEISSRDVRDTILGLLPDLMRIYSSSESVVEYQPTGEAEVEMAEQATDYANYVFMRDNPGFTILHSTFKDAMKLKTGIVKVWWDDAEVVRTEHYRNLDPLGLFLLDQDTDVEKIEIIEEIKVDSNGNPLDAPLVNARVKRRIKNGRIRVEPLPPEEFLIDRRARSLDYFNVCAHRSMKTVSELVALGYDEDLVREHVTSPELDTNVEYIARQPWARVVGSFDGMNPSTQRVLYCEAYAWIDADGDGIAELHRICTMGPSYKVVAKEPVDHVPFADFHCDPEPHTFFGESIYDATNDIQRIKTQIWRDSLDSLAQSVRPRMAIVEGQVNYEDVLNNEIGSIIRQRAPGMVQPLETPFVGQNAFPMIEYVDSVLEKRTGVSLQSLGLDPDALQSTTKLAVAQTISGSQGRVELLARILAEGMRKVFKLILHLSVTHQDRPRVVQLRGKWVPVDPRYWNADMDVVINVALGNGTTEQKLAILTGVKQAQEQILMTLGPNNPIVTLGQYSNTLRKMVELGGFKNANAFFNAVPANFQPPAPPQQPNPQMIVAQAEAQSKQSQTAIEAQRLILEERKLALEHQRLSDKDAADAALRLHELELKYRTQIHSDAIDALVGADAAHQQRVGDTVRHAMTQHANMRTAAMNAAAQQQTAREQMAADQQTAAMQAANQPEGGNQ
ncbi:MAG: hypothetical protein QJR04_25305 [Burkholderia multivorans]|nr:hypothetical protein [Burkholderia multivorans]